MIYYFEGGEVGAVMGGQPRQIPLPTALGRGVRPPKNVRRAPSPIAPGRGAVRFLPNKQSSGDLLRLNFITSPPE